MARRPSTRSQRILLWTLVGVVAVAALTVLRVPRGDPMPKQVEETPIEDAVVVVGLTIDSIDAARSTMKVRMSAFPGPKMPAEGVTVFTTIAGLPELKVATDKLTPEATSEIEFASGDVADYPFDRYHTEIGMFAVAGRDATVEAVTRQDSLPVAIQGFVTASGFDVRADARTEQGAAVVAIDTSRTGGSRGWVVAMMTMYWALAASSLAVILAVALGDRAWETRHLAWLGSMIFALVTFRNAAPGSPPIGTFMDTSAFFPALTIVAGSLITMVAYYLVSPRERLKL